MRERARATAIAILLCGAGSAHAAAPVASTLLLAHCAPCHHAHAPVIDGSAPLERALALRAALLVAAGRMPPRAPDDDTRAQLIAVLCDLGASDASACRAALSPLRTTPPVRADLERALADAVPPRSDERRLPAGWRRYAVPTAGVLHLDPTLALLPVLVAAERCRTDDRATLDERCTRKLLDLSPLVVPPPMPARGRP